MLSQRTERTEFFAAILDDFEESPLRNEPPKQPQFAPGAPPDSPLPPDDGSIAPGPPPTDDLP